MILQGEPQRYRDLILDFRDVVCVNWNGIKVYYSNGVAAPWDDPGRWSAIQYGGNSPRLSNNFFFVMPVIIGGFGN